MRFLSVCALVFAVGLGKVERVDAQAGIDTDSIQKVFSSASVGQFGSKKLAINCCCYSQSYYQAYYQSYYQGSYNITFSGTVAAQGNVSVTTNMGKGSGTFVIDHPLDPKNSLLYHSFVESPDVKNWYDGIATLNTEGKATIRLPSYFDALNTDVRYQLKPVGAPMPNLHVALEENDNAFTIGGGAPHGQVSWQVTGIRHDAFIRANPIIPEVDKGPDQVVDKGEYLFAEGYETPLGKFWSSMVERVRGWLPK